MAGPLANTLPAGAAQELAKLRGLHLPPEIGWWPPAPGWWVLGCVLVMSLAASCYWIYRRFRRNRYRREASLAIRQAYERHQQGESTATYLQCLNQILRRAALVAFPRAQVAGLTGPAWLSFLSASSGIAEFTGEAGRDLIESAYRPQVDCDGERLQLMALGWIRRHDPARWQRSQRYPEVARRNAGKLEEGRG